MRVFVEGSGAREHCLRVLLARTAEIVAQPDEADLIVVGPEVPLVAGYADKWRARGKAVFGPGADGARLEGSKAFLKAFLQRANIPTAKFGTFTEAEEAIAFLQTMKAPYVIKTSGLAAGKGVLVTQSLDEAMQDVRDKLNGESFGAAGETIVIEEGLIGEEFSLFVVTDGERFHILPAAQDFKRVFDNDEGPNTGGMGAYSPLNFVTDDLLAQVEQHVIVPTLEQLRAENIEYRGVIYMGMMLTTDGPKVIEYNVRFGDPDSQVSLIRYDGDITQMLYSAATGNLETGSKEPLSEVAVNVVLAAANYPGVPTSGDVITGIEDAQALDNVHVLFAGVRELANGDLVTSGGRVLNVLATAPTLREAREKAYVAVEKIYFAGMHYRRDIAQRAAEQAARRTL